MAVSGLDSIALAVAHLERVENAASISYNATSTSDGNLTKTTTFPPSLFLNHARVVSTDHFDANHNKTSSGSSSSPLSQSPRDYYPALQPSFMEQKPFNYLSTFDNALHPSLASLNMAAMTADNANHHIIMNGTTLSGLPPPNTPLQAEVRRCSSISSSSSSSSSPQESTKHTIQQKAVKTLPKSMIPRPHHQSYKNLMLFFEMAPYPIPKDMHAGDALLSTAGIQEDDVLLGRGGETNHHTGNIQYRMLVKACQPAYLAAKRRDKPRIAAGIVLAVRRAGGRFLKKDDSDKTSSSSSDHWRDVGNVRAREKTSQALREGAPDLRPQLSL